MRDVALEHSMIYVSPDYRAATSWMGPKAEADVVQIINGPKRAYRVGRVFVCGGSMGGSSALTFTALHPDLVDCVVCLNGTANHIEYDQFQDAIRESFGGTKQEKLDEYKKRSAEYWPERLTMPVAITAGGKDTTVPPASTVRLARVLEKLGRPVLLILREDGGHATNYEDTKAAFEYVIKRAASK
jgi:pimeloyl-ACP methyl ester carboxylesterase